MTGRVRRLEETTKSSSLPAGDAKPLYLEINYGAVASYI